MMSVSHCVTHCQLCDVRSRTGSDHHSTFFCFSHSFPSFWLLYIEDSFNSENDILWSGIACSSSSVDSRADFKVPNNAHQVINEFLFIFAHHKCGESVSGWSDGNDWSGFLTSTCPATRRSLILALVPAAASSSCCLSSPDSGMAMLSVCFSLLVACLVVVAKDVVKLHPDVMKWQDLKVLRLQNGNLTHGSVPRPHLAASRGSSELNDVTCIVTGQAVKQKKNFPRLEWLCVPHEIPWTFKMDVERVTCECYDLCRDDYILIGSCSLEYSVSSGFVSAFAW